jgi:uncharacterized coiled-coil DUF342 family protein
MKLKIEKTEMFKERQDMQSLMNKLETENVKLQKEVTEKKLLLIELSEKGNNYQREMDLSSEKIESLSQQVDVLRNENASLKTVLKKMNKYKMVIGVNFCNL